MKLDDGRIVRFLDIDTKFLGIELPGKQIEMSRLLSKVSTRFWNLLI